MANLDSSDANRLISYLEELLGVLRKDEEPIPRLIRFRENLSADGFIPPSQTVISSAALVHHEGVAKWFEELLESDHGLVRQWADRKLVQLDREGRARAQVREVTRVLPPTRTGRRIVVFIDGTSNTPEELRHTPNYSLMNPPPITNVVRLLRAVITDDDQSARPQIIGYFRGVATDGSAVNRTIDGVSGRGLSRIILDAYRFISHNLEWVGDAHAKLNLDEIYIFGFSRGAYAARALNGFLNRFGLIKKHALWLLPFFFEAYQRLLASGGELDPRTKRIWLENVHPEYTSIPVHFLGVWDTVGALGIPVSGLSWITVDYEKFHDTSLTPNVTHAYQALAIHELRHPFKPVFWTSKPKTNQIVEQCWFAGAHSNVGGGYSNVGLSSCALDWMAFKAGAAGLDLDTRYLASELASIRVSEPIAVSRRIGHGQPGPINRMKVYRRALERPLDFPSINAYLKRYFPGQTMTLDVFQGMKAHWSVVERLASSPVYADDRARFERMDKLSRGLPEVSRKESLVP